MSPRKQSSWRDPVVEKPKVGSPVNGYLNLLEVAYSVGKLMGVALTIPQITGAIRALKLKDNTREYSAKVKGCIIWKQQTMVHVTQLKKIEDYLKEKFEKEGRKAA